MYTTATLKVLIMLFLYIHTRYVAIIIKKKEKQVINLKAPWKELDGEKKINRCGTISF